MEYKLWYFMTVAWHFAVWSITLQYTVDQFSFVYNDETLFYLSGMSSLKDMTVQLGIHAAWIVRDKGKLGISRAGGAQGDPTQSVSHQEGLHTRGFLNL